MPIGKNLAALIGLKAGQVITQIEIQAAWSRLKRTGFFSKIELDFIEGPAKKGGETPAVYLRFIGTGIVVIQTSMSNTARGAASTPNNSSQKSESDCLSDAGVISSSESPGEMDDRHQTAERIRAGHR